MGQGKADKQAGEKLFNALRKLEVQFMNGGLSVQTSAQKLLKDYNFTPANEMAKYLISQSILKKDTNLGTHKKPYYWYNGPKLSVKYCNSLILQMKLDRSVSKQASRVETIGAPFDEKVESPKVDEKTETNELKLKLKQEMLDEAIKDRDKARLSVDLYSKKLHDSQIEADELSIVVKFLSKQFNSKIQ